MTYILAIAIDNPTDEQIGKLRGAVKEQLDTAALVWAMAEHSEDDSSTFEELLTLRHRRKG